jgi:hypothetical protein
MNIEFLLLLLRDIDKCTYYITDVNNIIINIDEMIRGVIVYANNLLFTDNFECNWYNIDILQKEGYNVFPREIDEMGWVTGCIQTKRGIIIYG